MQQCCKLRPVLQPALSLTCALQTLGMPEAARHASALLSLPPSHAACRSSDVGATLQQQQRLSSAIRAGTATLHQEQCSDGSLEASALSGSLQRWASTSQIDQVLTVTVYDQAGNVCQWKFAAADHPQSRPVFQHDDSKLGVAFTQAKAAVATWTVALINLTQPDEQPVVVSTGILTGPLPRMEPIITAAPLARMFLVCGSRETGLEPNTVILSFLGSGGSNHIQHQAPSGAQLPYNDGKHLFSPDSRYICLTSQQSLYCLDIQTSVWHCLQQLVYMPPVWLQLPACTPRLLVEQDASSLALITAPHLAVSHTQPKPCMPCHCSVSSFGRVSCVDSDRRLHVLPVATDAPSGQPFLHLLFVWDSLPLFPAWTISPDSCWVLCCSRHPAVDNSGARQLHVYDTQTAAEVSCHTLHTYRWLQDVAWREQGLMLEVEAYHDGPRYFKVARWVL